MKVDAKAYPGVTHEFFGMGAVIDKAKDAEEHAAKNMRNAFHKGAPQARTPAPRR